MSNHYLFMATGLQGVDIKIPPHMIWEMLTEKKVWYLTPSAPYRNRFVEGDRIVFYLGGKEGGRVFVGQGTVAGVSEPLTRDDEAFLAALGLPFFGWRVPLSEAITWGKQVPIKNLVPELTFIKDKQNYGLHLRSGIVAMSEADYQRILGAACRGC